MRDTVSGLPHNFRHGGQYFGAFLVSSLLEWGMVDASVVDEQGVEAGGRRGPS